jgi:hypothetical protein
MGLPELAGPITSKTKFGSRRRAVRHAAPAHAGYTIALRRPPALLGHERNGQPQPFNWTKDPNKITGAVKRGHQTLDSIH